MGLIQRVIEESGIPTISITLSQEIAEKVKPPRAVLPGFPLGHPMGMPFDADGQRTLMKKLLEYVGVIREPGTLVNLSTEAGTDTINTEVTE
ncbi:hypothetical protein ACFL6S_23585 [Candidatus Poribacteria bacterium]